MTSTAVPATSDLYDELGERASVCDTQFRLYGSLAAFEGTVATVSCHEDNVLVRAFLSEPGEGRVLVVDGGGSLHCALMGDIIAGLAVDNGWVGVVVNGAVRDVPALRTLDLGVAALGATPRKSAKNGAGERQVAVSFGGAVFTPGDRVVVDEDGVLVVPA